MNKFKAVDKFRDELMDKFLRLCNYNDFSKLNLEKIADTIETKYMTSVLMIWERKMRGNEKSKN